MPHAARDIQTIFDSLRRIVQALRRSSAQSERSAGLTAAQVFILKSLQGRPGCSINDLAELVHSNQSTVSEAVTRLVSRGLVHRRQASQDRRRVELSLSTDGVNAIANSLSMPQDELIAAIVSMPESKRAALVDGLTALITAAGMDDVAPQLFFEEIQDLT